MGFNWAFKWLMKRSFVRDLFFKLPKPRNQERGVLRSENDCNWPAIKKNAINNID